LQSPLESWALAILLGVDVDEQALAAARGNSAANGVTARYTDPAGLPPGTFDIVLANILSNPLKLLAPALLARVAPRGALVLSGVLERQAEGRHRDVPRQRPARGSFRVANL